MCHFVKMSPGVLSVILSLVVAVSCDIYLHNPRGSNNRLDEETRNRANNDRMFDSQNNNRGGYNVGSLYYYAGSTLQIEWTNQHSCASPHCHCELVLQYMCDGLVRDGATTKTIPEANNQNQCENFDCNTDKNYGMNEDIHHYSNCRMRKRNQGLFNADQNLRNRNRQYAVNTRQNPNGNRRGYECPEERDYYPYWHPSPWKDIAVMTNDVSRCVYYQRESENVKSRWACYLPKELVIENYKSFVIPNNKEDCEAFTYPNSDPDAVRGVWKEYRSHGLSPPDCRETEFSRDNHLGNGLGGQPNVYNWTIPDISHENCVLRMRYNISTNDYDPWNTTSANNSPNLAPKYGFGSRQAAEERGYEFEGNPDVKVFDDADFTLELAINTAQYGRTFQDRSHSFAIRKRPAGYESTQIHNLNVRGKRGNIVQVYPSVEYDFVPNNLQVSTGDAVHIQWTGSNTNNPNNEGNGLARTDRNNILQLKPRNFPEGNGVQFGPGRVYGHFGNNYPDHLTNSSFLGLSRTDVGHLAMNSPGQFGGELSQLDDAGPYFDMGLRKVSQTGTYHYMCTRNNDFSNRDQKGRVTVYPYPQQFTSIGWTGGQITLPTGQASVNVQQGAFTGLQKLTLAEWTRDQGDNRLNSMGRSMQYGDEYASNFYVLSPESQLTDDAQKVTITIAIDDDAYSPEAYWSTQDSLGTWVKVDASVEGTNLMLRSDRGGVFVVRSHSNYGPIIGIVVACVALVIIVVGAVVYFKRNPDRWIKLKKSTKYFERSMQEKV